jgi:polysaccharide pyruvyl transferase WcaK-like protein
MRIGILTLHWVPNFGANLQVLSMMKLLERMGHEAIVLNYRALGSIKYHAEHADAIQIDRHEAFLDQYVKQTALLHNEEEIIMACEKENIDCVIIGSDAVFRVRASNREDVDFRNPYWASWQSKANIPVIACAVSSMGVNLMSIDSSEKRWISERLKNNFTAISARDKWTRSQLIMLSRRKIRLLPDPVLVTDKNIFPFGLDSDDQLKVLKDKKYIVIAFLRNYVSNNWISALKNEVNRRGFLLVSLPHPGGQNALDVDVNIRIPITPDGWYSCIAESSGIIAHRFHPIVIAASNSVPFVALDNYRKGSNIKDLIINKHRSKTYDLCSQLGIKKNNIKASSIDMEKNSASNIIDLLLQTKMRAISANREKLVARFGAYLKSNLI